MDKRLYPFKRVKRIALLFVFTALTSLSCTMKKPQEQREIEQAMLHYHSLQKKMDADSIRLFLASFKIVNPLRTATTSDSIGITEDTAVQDGHYAQSAVVNGDRSGRLRKDGPVGYLSK